MTNKILLLAIVMLLFASSAQAATQTFSGWLKNGESTTTEKQSFLIQISSTNNKVWADYGTGSLQVANNSCEQTLTAKVCVDNIEQMLPDRRYRAYVRIFLLAPKITITREFANTEFIIGNDTVVTATIENEGDVATEVSYVDPLSEDITIEEISGAIYEEGKVVWKGIIKAEDSKEITYRIRATKIMDRKFSATATYSDGFEHKTESSSEVNLKVTPFVTITAKINGRTDLFIGEIFNYTLNITNLDSRAVHFNSVEIKTDKGIELIEKPFEMKKIDDLTYKYENWNLINNKSKVLRFKAKGKLVSESNIYARADYKGFDAVPRKTDEQKNSVKISEKGVTIKTNLGEEVLEENEQKKLIISVSNNNPSAAIKDVFVSTGSDLFYIPDGYYETLEASKTQRIEKTFKAPKVQSQRGYKIQVNVTYTTEYGDSGSKTLTDTLSITPIKDLIITQTLDKVEVESGEQAVVKLKVENPRLVKVNNVKIVSNVPEQLIVNGVTTNTINIYSKENIDGLAYFITAPKVRKNEYYNITTLVSYEENGKAYSYNATSGITVKPKDLKLTVTKSVTESNIYEGEPFSVTYSIKNPSEEDSAQNVLLKFPLQQEFDLVTEKEYMIPHIGPGELVYLYDKERVRAKYNTTLTLLKTTAYYENAEGTPFNTNTSEVSLKIQTSYKKGPYIILEKSAPENANNLDGFNVSIQAKNIGNEQGTVLITDGQHEFGVLLDPGSEKNFSYTTRIPTKGSIELPRATARYLHANKSYTTASNIDKITISHKPIIAIERNVPAEGNIIDNLNITIKATNLLRKKISNLTIKDGEREWMIDQLEDAETVAYITNFTAPGMYSLGKVSGQYMFDGDKYEIETEEASIGVNDKKLITLEKTAPESAIEGENFSVSITAIAASYHLENVLLQDGDRMWNISLNAQERKTITYSMQLADSSPLEAAHATLTYNGREFIEYSNQANIEVRKGIAKPEQAEKTEEKKSGPLSGVIKFIKGILTWKRK